MKAVFEELNGNLAVFVVDNVSKMYHIEAAKLPKSARVGDVFEVELVGEDLKILDKLSEERKRREQANRLKREELLRRKK